MTRRQRKRKKKLQIRNKRLVKQYDFLLPRNVWTDKVPKGYDFSYIDWGWSDGWDKAFGMQYLKELGEAVKESKNPKGDCMLSVDDVDRLSALFGVIVCNAPDENEANKVSEK